MKREELEKLISEVTNTGIEIKEKTHNAVEELNNPHNSIVLTGCFQVGKSTLLNRVMLGSDVLLSEGNGIPTTAIPTKIIYGETKKLTVFFRDPALENKEYEDAEITDSLMRQLTTADSDEARLKLATEIKYIQLALPVENIRNFTFFDTPGVDDPNQHLIAMTTAEILPNSDLVVLVIDASTSLTQYSKSFLCKSIFQQGMSRVMVLASYNPKYYKSAEERAIILRTIKAELSSIGRDYIPVHAFTYDQETEGDILRGPDEIMSCLLKFIEDNKEQAKVDKVLFYLGGEIATAIEKYKAKLEVNGKTVEQLNVLDKKIEAAAISLDAEYVRNVNEFNKDFGKVVVEAGDEINSRLFDSPNSVLNQFIDKFSSCDNLEQTRNRVQSAISEISPIVQNSLTTIAAMVETRTKELLLKSSDKIAQAASKISISGEFVPSVSTGWCGKINPTILKILEVGGGFWFGGGVIPAILVLVSDKIPVLRQILPHNFTKTLVISSIKKSFTESLEMAKDNMLRQLEDSEDDVKKGIKEAFADIYAERIAPYTEARNKSSKILTTAEIENIELTIKKLEALNKYCLI